MSSTIASATFTYRPVPLGTQWDDIVRQDGGLLFASTRYLKYIKHLLPESREHHLGAFSNGKLIGVMPLFYKESLSGFRVANSSAFYGSHGGIYTICQGTERAECVQGLLGQYLETCRSLDISVGTVIEPLANRDTELYAKMLKPWKTDGRTGQIVRDITAHSGDMMTRYHYKTRNMIRKAVKDGMAVKTVVENDVPAALEFLFAVHLENMRAISGKAKSVEFFRDIPEFFRYGEDWLIYEAFSGNEKAASLLVFFFGDTVEYFTPVIRQEYRSQQPMSLLIHQAILDAASKGYRHFNFGGTWKTQEGVYRFKSRWDSTDTDYVYYVSTFTDETALTALACELDKGLYGFYLFPF